MKNKKKTNKQIYTTFVITIVLGVVVGIVAGFGGAIISDLYGGDIVGGLQQIFKVVVPVVYVVLMVLSYGYSFFNYNKAKKMIENWDGMDEEVLEEADDILGLATLPNNIMMVCNFFLYSAMVYLSGVTIPDFGKTNLKQGLPLLAVAVVVFLINMTIITVIQKLTVDLVKKNNPEKNGNIFDKDFNKDWLASCDEAEKQMIYEASYKAYQVTHSVCLALWLFTMIGMLLFDIGILPSLCVFVIWLALVLAYNISCYKLGHKKIR